MKRHVAPTLCLALSLAVVAPVSSAAAPPDADTRTVGLAGYQTDVPADWPVYDLSVDATRCVRFDQHAVYLGDPGPNQQCPARAVGRTEALLIQPLTDETVARLAAINGDPETQGMLRATFPEDGVVVSASFGADREIAARFVEGGRALPSVPVPEPPARTDVPTARVLTTGHGFDTCAAPSSASMGAWRASPYRTVGVYVGGLNRACGYGNLTPSWVRTVHGQGFSFIPTYVGRQAPCTPQSWAKMTPGNAAAEGRAAADDAVRQMRRLGFGRGNPVYLDIEHYSGPVECTYTVLTFVSAWTLRLNAHGYAAGVYSSASSGIHDLATHVNAPGVTPPDAIWIGHWDGKPQVFGDPYVRDSLWANRQRLKQYRGGHHETYAGVTINIDSDYLDGPVAVPGG